MFNALGVPVFFILMTCTDAGPDQALARKLIASEVLTCPIILFIDLNCVLHQYHLVCKCLLLIVDEFLDQLQKDQKGTASETRQGTDGANVNEPKRAARPKATSTKPNSVQNENEKKPFKFKYFSAVAKMVNVWRSNLSALSKVWHQLYPATSAAEVRSIHKTPRAACAGRWGSTEASEDFFFEEPRNPERIRSLFNTAFSKNKKVTKTTSSSAATPDESINELQAYREQQSKWIYGSLLAINNVFFWLVMKVLRHIRAPLKHFYATLEAYAKTTDFDSHDSQPLLHLVTKRCQQIMGEFFQLRDTLPAAVRQSVLALFNCSVAGICFVVRIAHTTESLHHCNHCRCCDLAELFVCVCVELFGSVALRNMLRPAPKDARTQTHRHTDTYRHTHTHRVGKS